MGGLILFACLGLYLWGCTRLTRWLLRICPWPIAWPRWPRVALYPLVLVLVFILPVADELLARPKFNSLCEKGAVLKIDAQRIRGTTVSVEITPDFYNQIIHVTTVPIRHSHHRYIDVTTGQVVASYDVYEMKGGLLSRLLSFPEGSPPWTGEAYCAPPDRVSFLKTYNVLLTN